MKLNLKTLSFTISVLFSTVTLSLHGYLGHFARYMADDFCTVFYAHRLGVFRSTWFWYLNWSGRFSASILDATVGSLGPRILPILVPLTIILWLAALIVLFLTFLDFSKNRILASFALGATSLFALFLLTPDIRQSLYWGQGMRSVVPPLIMGTIQIVLWNYIGAKDWTRAQRWFWGISSFLWALIAGGFSETYAAFQVSALIVAFLAGLMVQKFKFSNSSLFLTSSILGAVCALIIVLFAPGNSERQAFFPSPPGIASLLIISLQSYFSYLVTLINSLEKILAIIGLFSLATLAGSQRNREVDPRLLWMVPGLTLGFMFVCFPPAVYGTSEPPPGRTLILPTYFFLLGVLAWGLVIGQFFGKKQDMIASKLLPGLVIVTILLSTSMHSVRLYQSRQEFIEYARAWDKTDASIRQSKQSGAAQVLIPVTPNWASLNTPNDNPRFWVNICMSRYYDVQILATADPASASP